MSRGSTEYNMMDYCNNLLNNARQTVMSLEDKIGLASKHLERTHSVHHKLKIIQNEVSSLFASASRMWEGVQLHAKVFLDDISGTIDSQVLYCSELMKSLNHLKTISIHQGLRQSFADSMQSSRSMQESQSFKASKENLYDFVNIKSVNDLHQSAQENISELQSMKKIGEDHVSESKFKFDLIKSKNEELQQLLKKDSLKSINSEISFQTLRDNSQTKKLHAIYSSMLEEKDNLSKCINEYYQNNSEKEQILKRIILRLDDLMQSLRDIEKEILQLCSEAEEHYKTGNTFYKAAEETLDTVESFIPEMKKRLSQFENLSMMFDDWRNKSEVNQLYQEIHDLTIWYKYFPTAYDNLLLELHRRREAMIYQQKRIQEIQNELDSLYQKEINIREEFFDEFGRYLPSTIFPGILDPVPSYSIVSNIERSSSRVPSVTLTENDIDEIQKRLEQMQFSPKHNQSETDEQDDFDNIKDQT